MGQAFFKSRPSNLRAKQKFFQKLFCLVLFSNAFLLKIKKPVFVNSQLLNLIPAIVHFSKVVWDRLQFEKRTSLGKIVSRNCRRGAG